jgi:hypothetical protein
MRSKSVQLLDLVHGGRQGVQECVHVALELGADDVVEVAGERVLLECLVPPRAQLLGRAVVCFAGRLGAGVEPLPVHLGDDRHHGVGSVVVPAEEAPDSGPHLVERLPGLVHRGPVLLVGFDVGLTVGGECLGRFGAVHLAVVGHVAVSFRCFTWNHE